MQILIPYSNFVGSAKVLDSQRLSNQRHEIFSMMQHLLGKRLTNTHRFEPTGAYKTVYFNRDLQEINVESEKDFHVYSQTTTPVMHLVENPKLEWRIEKMSGNWPTHPDILMWVGYEHVLMYYQNVVCHEWASRRHEDSYRDKTAFLYNACRPITKEGYPDWLGDEDFHLAQQSYLLRHHPIYYSQFFVNVPTDLAYVYADP